MKLRTTLVSLAAMATLAAAAGCAAPEKESDTTTESGVDAASATSAEDFGGMDELVKAAQDEGTLNVIALPPDWANYGEVISTFEDKYDIEVSSDQPDAASQDEINAANDLKGTDRAPDVFDLGQSVALANTDLFAPYQVETWDDIPDEFKDPDGTWVNDYGGYMSIGYDSSVVPDVTSVADLMKPEFKGKVALNGDPTQAGAAFSGVMMAAIANGGSADDIAPGVDFFADLKKAGNFLTVDPDSTTIEQGTDAGRHRLGLPRRGRGGQRRHVEDGRPRGGRRRGLLLPGDQRRRAAPGRRAAVAGVPLQRRGPEPLAQGWRPSGPRRRDGRGRHHRRGALGSPARGHRRPGHPDRRPDGDRRRVPRSELVQGHPLSTSTRVSGGTGRRFAVGPALPLLPFLLFVLVFLVVPTLTVVLGAFQDEDGRPTLGNLDALTARPPSPRCAAR